MLRAVTIVVSLLVVSLTVVACSYVGYRAGESIDEHGTKSFPMAMKVLDGLSPEETVQIHLDDGTRIEGRFLGLVPADSSVSYDEPLPHLGEHVIVRMRDGGRSLEGDLVGYDWRRMVIRSDVERTVVLSRVRYIETKSGERLDIFDILVEMQLRRAAMLSAVRVYKTSPEPIGTTDIPLDTIQKVGRPAGVFFRAVGLVTGAIIDLAIITFGVVGSIIDATE